MNKILEAQVRGGSISHAYILEGSKEKVKDMYTDFIELVFESEDTRSKELGLDRFFDVYFIRPENKTIGIDTIREMKKKVFEIPLEAEYKIFVIENADLMRAEAQNALLKTLEEAPSYCIIILTTDNRNKLYDTIISRCQVVSDYLETEADLTEEDKGLILDLFQKSHGKEYYSVISSRQVFDKFQDKKNEIINYSIKFFYDVILNKLGQADSFSSRYKRKLDLFEGLSISKLEKLIFKLEKINDLTRVNINFQLAMEDFLFALMEE